MTLAVKVALNPNTTNRQSKLLYIGLSVLVYLSVSMSRYLSALVYLSITNGPILIKLGRNIHLIASKVQSYTYHTLIQFLAKELFELFITYSDSSSFYLFRCAWCAVLATSRRAKFCSWAEFWLCFHASSAEYGRLSARSIQYARFVLCACFDQRTKF